MLTYNACSKVNFTGKNVENPFVDPTNNGPQTNSPGTPANPATSPTAFSILGVRGSADITPDALLSDILGDPIIDWQASANTSSFEVHLLESDQKVSKCSAVIPVSQPVDLNTPVSVTLANCQILANEKYFASVKAIGLDGVSELPAADGNFEFITSGAPTKVFDFRNQSPAEFTMARNSTATFFDKDGLLKVAPVNAPRIDHEPATGETLGVLVEDDRTNQVRFSEEFENLAGWTRLSANVAANATIGPDGLMGADKIIENANNGNHGVRQSFNGLPANTDITYSVFAKMGERRWLYLSTNSTSSSFQSFFDLLDGGVEPNPAPEHSTATMQEIGNGWYRITARINSGNGGNITFGLFTTNAQMNPNYTGDGASGLFVWGAQLEVGINPSSYIPTAAATVTRASEHYSTLDLSWYNQAAGSFSFQNTHYFADLLPDFWKTMTLSNGTTQECFRVLFLRDEGRSTVEVRDANFNSELFIAADDSWGIGKETRTISSSLVNNDVSIFELGGLVGNDNNVTLPNPVSKLTIGDRQFVGGGNQAFGHYRQFKYWNERLPNSSLQYASQNFDILGIRGGGDVVADQTYAGGADVNPIIEFEDLADETGYSISIFEADKTTIKCKLTGIAENSTSATMSNCSLEANSTYWVDIKATNNNTELSVSAANGLFRFRTP